MFSKVITFIVLLMIASSAYSFKSHLDRFIHGKSLEVSLICLWFSSLILTNFSLGDHDHTYLHNPSNGSCFEEEVLKKGPKNCQPDPRFSRENCYKCCTAKCPGDEFCKYGMAGYSESCDAVFSLR